MERLPAPNSVLQTGGYFQAAAEPNVNPNQIRVLLMLDGQKAQQCAFIRCRTMLSVSGRALAEPIQALRDCKLGSSAARIIHQGRFLDDLLAGCVSNGYLDEGFLAIAGVTVHVLRLKGDCFAVFALTGITE